jgi:hypothetical protein
VTLVESGSSPSASIDSALVSKERPSPTQLIADGAIDAQLCALLWMLVERGVPFVAAARDVAAAEKLRSALGVLAVEAAATDDGAIPGGTVLGDSLEDVLRLSGSASYGQEIGDEARDLGVVCILKQRTVGPGFLVTSAHYVRPIERDAAGHLQRRPPALLTAWDAGVQRFDHFFWAITDELATRVDLDAYEFEVSHRRRTQLLDDLCAAGVLERSHVRRHIERALLVDAHAGVTPADARH